jgi:hypothetical protein
MQYLFLGWRPFIVVMANKKFQIEKGLNTPKPKTRSAKGLLTRQNYISFAG